MNSITEFKREFTRTRRGYSPEEVDAAIELLITYGAELESANAEFAEVNNSLIADNDALAAENDRLNARLTQMGSDLDTVKGELDGYRQKVGEAKAIIGEAAVLRRQYALTPRRRLSRSGRCGWRNRGKNCRWREALCGALPSGKYAYRGRPHALP